MAASKKKTTASNPALEKALENVHKKYGTDSIMKMGERSAMTVETISSGNIDLDIALGGGVMAGFPKGRIAEVYGPESSGKTTLALHVIAEAQRQGGTCAFIDAEHALDPKYAGAIGVDVDEMFISQPGHGEEALNITRELVRSGAFDVIVIDSVAALTPLSELKGEVGDSSVGSQPRMMSQAMRLIAADANNSKTIVIFINQIREKIGVMFGSPEVTPGGRALKFYSSIRIDIRRKDQIKGPENQILGNITKIKIVKNKVAPPFHECEVTILYGEGMSAEMSLLDVGVDLDVLRKSGAWYYDMDGESIGQGRENARLALVVNPEWARKIRAAIDARLLADLEPEEVDEPEAVEA